jgi:hypothetical protein
VVILWRTADKAAPDPVRSLSSASSLTLALSSLRRNMSLEHRDQFSILGRRLRQVDETERVRLPRLSCVAQPGRHRMQHDSPKTNVIMVIIFMGLVLALAALLFVMIAYGHGNLSGPGGLPLAR